jgi:hypothetical protein
MKSSSSSSSKSSGKEWFTIKSKKKSCAHFQILLQWLLNRDILCHILVNVKSTLGANWYTSPRLFKYSSICSRFSFNYCSSNFFFFCTYQYLHKLSPRLLQQLPLPFPLKKKICLSVIQIKTFTHMGSTTIECPHAWYPALRSRAGLHMDINTWLSTALPSIVSEIHKYHLYILRDTPAALEQLPVKRPRRKVESTRVDQHLAALTNSVPSNNQSDNQRMPTLACSYHCQLGKSNVITYPQPNTREFCGME